MKRLTFLVVFLIGMLTGQVVHIHAENPNVLKNAQYAYDLHEGYFSKGEAERWHWVWMQNYAAQMGQNVVVSDIKALWESGYFNEELSK